MCSVTSTTWSNSDARSRLDHVIIALPLTADRRVQEIVHKLKVLPADLLVSAEFIAEKFPIRV